MAWVFVDEHPDSADDEQDFHDCVARIAAQGGESFSYKTEGRLDALGIASPSMHADSKAGRVTPLREFTDSDTLRSNDALPSLWSD